MLTRVKWFFYALFVNLFWRGARIKIVAPKYIAPTARLRMRPDGYYLGGEIEIAEGARISDFVLLAPYGGRIRIGRNAYIGPHSVLYGHGRGLHIGDDVLIAAQATFIPANHGFSDTDRPIRHQASEAIGITIMDDVWIGSGARILDGVTLGKGCVVGAGAVVTQSVSEFDIVAGVPARQIGRRQAKAGLS